MFDTVPDMAARRAELTPHAAAFADRSSGRSWSFAEVNGAADAMAHGLQAAGLAPGDRLGILCHNCAEFFVALFACQKTGIILCPLNWRQTAAELAETLDQIAPSALLHDQAQAPLAAALAARLDCPLFDLGRDLERWTGNGGPAMAEAIPAQRPWYLLFTSGTTGRPKAVIQTARMAWANMVNIGSAVSLTRASRTVNFLPLFHTSGINLYTLPVFLLGGHSVILPKFDAAALLALFRDGEIDQFFGVPTIYREFSLSSEIDRVDWSRIRCGCGGAALPEPLIRAFAERGARVLNGCGMTETGPTVFLMDEAMAQTKIGSVGQAQILTRARLDGVPDGTPGTGEIQLNGPNITPGYYGDAAATAELFTADGWLKSGDVGRRDADGYMFIVDRIKDMYISGGENVYPAEVERVLHGHPDILEAAVVGIPDSRWGETGAAFVIARPGRQPDPEALRRWCREGLAGYKVPAQVHLVADLPRTPAGKVRKPALKALMPCPSS